MEVWAWILVIGAGVVIGTRVRVISEHQRLARHLRGACVAFKGPGLVLTVPGKGMRWTRVAVGDPGELLDETSAMIQGVRIPIELEGAGTVGQRVRVQGFTPTRARVVVDANAHRRGGSP